ncbi:MAG: guanylate kinase [Myxococcales bacterium]|nr:guanylate kinase [Myxococcales bacterium]MCB9708337.1 guanylate kinase [Myxococcales bacterium]
MTPAFEDLLLLIISSPSGAGKTTLTRELLRTFPELMFSVSHTTRAMRHAEADGRDYHFVSRPEFEALIDSDAFLEWAKVHDKLYGTGLAELDRARAQGKHGIVFDIDYQGARQIKAKLSQVVTVFILPPNMQELHRRLLGRAADAPLAIERRVSAAQREIEHYGLFDYLIVNDDLEQAQARLRSIVFAEFSRRSRMASVAEKLLREARAKESS